MQVFRGHRPPRHTSRQIINLPSNPSLISRFLINQQGFDVDFGEHGLLVELLRVADLGYLRRNQQFTGEQKGKGKIGTDRLIPGGRVCRIVPNPARSK